VTGRILLIEDDPRLAEMVQRYLGEAGFDVVIAPKGELGIARHAREGFDCIILDLTLPDIDGLDVCRRIRMQAQTPVLMLTARGQVVDRVVGLKLGADDYLTKPFEMMELLARVEALLRRSRTMAANALAYSVALRTVTESDIAGSALLLVLFAPLLLVIAAVVKASSQGPVLFKQHRVGQYGRRFTFLKFRSMYTTMDRSHVAHANEKQGHIFKMKQDPRVTPIGRFIRRCSLDELPQLINVLRGEMSLVGPRPLPAGDLGPDGMSREFADWSESRALVYPGITGLWHVNGHSELPFEDMVRLDLQYIREWSLLLDIKIILARPGQLRTAAKEEFR